MDLDYRSATMTRTTFAPNGMTFSGVHYWYVRTMLSFYVQPRILLKQIKEMGIISIIKSGLSFLFKAAIGSVKYLV